MKLLNGHNMAVSTLGIKPRRLFDPRNRDDLLEYKYFITKGHWKGGSCPFQLQWPYLTIPNMLHEMVARQYVTKELK